MRHQKRGRKLSRRREHRKSMLANLAASLIKNERVKTTDAKAKEIRPFVERMVTFAKRGDLHARRIVLSRLRDSIAVKKLFDEIGPRYTNRFGGYTRILKLGFRHGDNSQVSLIEFVEDEEGKSAVKAKPAKKKTQKKPAEEVKKAEAAVETEDAAVEEKPEEVAAEEAAVEEVEKTEKTAEEEKAAAPPEESAEEEKTAEEEKAAAPPEESAEEEKAEEEASSEDAEEQPAEEENQDKSE